MEFSTFPFDAHICNFKVHSLEDPNATLQFRNDPETKGVAWKTQTILEHRVRFDVLDKDEMRTSFKDLTVSYNLAQAAATL